MSLFALGLAAELRETGIAVNTIWPKTGLIELIVETLIIIRIF